MPLSNPKFLACPQLVFASNDSPVLKKFSKGDGVRLVQESLKQILGVDLPLSTLPDGKMDGDYGKETRETVQIFQRIHDLDDDGRVGKNTLKKLEEELVKNAPKPAPPPPKPIVNLPKLVTGVINSVIVPHRKYFNFHFAKYPNVGVGDALFTHVVQLIGRNRIRIKHDPELGDTAKYFIEGNVLALGNLDDSLTNSAVIFHECVHALLDTSATPMIDAYSEGLAYIAQSIFTQLKTTPYGLDGSDDLLVVVQEANKIARRVIEFHKSTRERDIPLDSCTIHDQEAKMLVGPIDRSKTYFGSLNKMAEYNGIKERLGDY